MMNIPELFGSMVFNDTVMKKRLSSETYAEFKSLMDNGEPLTKEIANIIAGEMKSWAIEKGATHYTHWFQPMTGITAEKHDSFITPMPDGSVIMKFSGKELIKGESDASSFPSGGLRSTFEARGYTAWDPTSPAFIKDGTLCIPTAFCSYSGQVLDKKTALLRSAKVLSNVSCRLLKCFGYEGKHVEVTAGPEQEYFLIDAELFKKRKDLIFCGRTLFGAKPSKGQELEDHYYGNIKPRVLHFMEELDRELWKMGVLAKTRHNEVAPSQHELAPVYTLVNVAADHNQLTMETMKKVAAKNGLVCLLHEKPFAGVNGSGKHNNWSLQTEDGKNLLEPGKNPQENLQFLLFLCAVLTAVDRHQDLLRLSVTNAGNDHRLGANEAPPAIISVYLGDELTGILDAYADEKQYNKRPTARMNMGVNVIPAFLKDTADRNRTSPFAFTGNKFEFRMLGSTTNISCPNAMINTAVAEALDEYANVLENSKNFEADVKKLIKESYLSHRRIVFNGNGYSAEWEKEAEKRGLLNLKTTPAALVHYTDKKNIDLFGKYDIYTPEELAARREILLENYAKIVLIEAQTMVEMAGREIVPACLEYSGELALVAKSKRDSGAVTDPKTEKELIKRISTLTDQAYELTGKLRDRLCTTKTVLSGEQAAFTCRDTVLPVMTELRAACDALEELMPKNRWPFPTYSELLFST